MKWKTVLILLVALTACGSGGQGDAVGQSDTSVPGQPAAGTTGGSTGASGAASPVEATWKIATITQQLLVDGGLTPREAHAVLADNDAEHEISSTLRLQDGHWQGFIASDGGADVPAQAGSYTLEGDTIVMIELPARYVYRWSIDEQGRLHIKVVSIENAPGIDGVDDSVFQFALYESQPLERIG